MILTMLRAYLKKKRHHKYCKRVKFNCPDCIYHDFIFEGTIFRGNRCRWGKEVENERTCKRNEDAEVVQRVQV